MEHRVMLICLVAFINYFNCIQSLISPQSILQFLTSQNGLKTFGQWAQESQSSLLSGAVSLTVFAFNDSSYATMPAADKSIMTTLTQQQRKDYLETFIVYDKLLINSLTESNTVKSLNGITLFISERSRTYWSTGSTTGETARYVNGARVLASYECSNGIVHVFDRVPLPVSVNNIYGWMQKPDDSNIPTVMWKDLMTRLSSDPIYFQQATSPISQAEKATMFIPSEAALRKIPPSKLAGLTGMELAKFFKMHYILGKVVYTSFVENQEAYDTGDLGTRLLFMRQDDKIFVKSGGVTAMVERGNITVRNGVIHIIERMLGYTYNSAREQIQLDAPIFNRYIDGVTPELLSLIGQPSNVNLLVPTDAAFSYVQKLSWINFDTNSTLRDYVVRLCMVKDGTIEVSALNGNYDVRQRRSTQYRDWKLVYFMDRNDTWVNSGNVRARIIRPDISVTTGRLQYIEAVPGIPSMDIPTLIYYDDYLIISSSHLKLTGLDIFMKDPRYDPNILPARSFDGTGQSLDSYGTLNSYFTTLYPNQYPTQYAGQTTQYPNNLPASEYIRLQQLQLQQQQQNSQNTNQQSTYGSCGHINNVCQFTVFIPNGTAIYNYYMTQLGQRVMKDVSRYRYVLRRHIIPGQLIFLEQMVSSTQSYRYKSHSGEEISIRRETENLVRIYWGTTTARVIMWDLGATNGVVHIVDTVLSDMSDIDRDISDRTTTIAANICIIISLVILVGSQYIY